MTNLTYTVLHLFGGLGGAALGMQEAETEYRGVRANFLTWAESTATLTPAVTSRC